DVLIRERVMMAAAVKLNLVTTDDRLQRLFITDPQFAPLRNPDGSVNKEFLAAQGMSSESFEQRLRQDLTLKQVMQGINGTVFAPASVAGTALDAFFQQRETQVQRFDPKDYAARSRRPTPSSTSSTRTRPMPRCSRRLSRPTSSTWCSTWNR